MRQQLHHWRHTLHNLGILLLPFVMVAFLYKLFVICLRPFLYLFRGT